MTVIAQDNHLTTGAWAGCGLLEFDLNDPLMQL